MHDYSNWSEEKLRKHMKLSGIRRSQERLQNQIDASCCSKQYKTLWCQNQLVIMLALKAIMELDDEVCNLCGHDFDPINCRNCPDCPGVEGAH